MDTIHFEKSKELFKEIKSKNPNMSLDEVLESELDENKKLKGLFALLDEIDNLQKAYNFDIETLRNKLINAGIQGKLTEQLLEDGTAEALYEDIQKEKARLIKEKKIKKEKNTNARCKSM